jgi:hypothetical protein
MNTWNENPCWLEAAVESYLNQKNVIIQLIVSTVEGDPSIALLKNYPQLEFCINEKSGIYEQLNKACELICYPWFAYAASDDIALPTKLFDEINMCLDNNKKICSSACHKTDGDLNIISTYKVPDSYSIVDNLRGCFVSDCALVSTEILKKYGPFDEAMDNMAHWDFWLRVAIVDPNVFIFNKEATWLYRQHSNARHIKRQGQVNKIKKREAARKRLMQKHYHLLEKYGAEHLASINSYK